MYVFGCANGVYPCTGNESPGDEPADRPVPGAEHRRAVGTLVPNSGDPRTALFAAGQGIDETNYTFPELNVGPRFGMAYDVTGTQRFVVRGGVGTYFDRPRPGDAQALAANTAESVSVRYSQLQNLGTGGLTHEGRPVDHRVRVRREDAHGHGVERRVPDPAALGHLARRGLHRPPQLQRAGRRPGLPDQHQHDRSRDGVQSGAAGSVDRAERHSGRLVARRAESQPGARIPRLRQHHLPEVRRLADVPFHGARAQSPVHERLPVRVQRHAGLVGRPRRRSAVRPRAGRSGGASGRSGAGAGPPRQPEHAAAQPQGHRRLAAAADSRRPTTPR